MRCIGKETSNNQPTELYITLTELELYFIVSWFENKGVQDIIYSLSNNELQDKLGSELQDLLNEA